MPKHSAAALAGFVLALPLAACGDGEPKADPAAIDQHLNEAIARDEAERRRLVEEARAREDVREEEMKEREANLAGNESEPNESANAAE